VNRIRSRIRITGAPRIRVNDAASMSEEPVMDEVRVVRRRTYIWPVVIAIIILAIVIAWALFGMNVETEPEFGWLLREAVV
jgi:hypothetical protein